MVPTRPGWAVVVLSTAMTLPLVAQYPAPLAAGARIRLTVATTATLIATARSWSGDTLRLQNVRAATGMAPASALGPEPYVLLSTIRTLEVSRNRHSHWRVGAGVGAVVGFGVGLAVARSEDGTSTLWSLGRDASRKTWELLGGMFGGALVGGLVGSAIHSEQWQALPLKSLQVAPVGVDRIGVTISLSM